MGKEEVQNKMGTMPVGKLMLNMGIPMILSMMLQAVYNIVDSVFVANIEGTGEAALNGLTLAFPIQMLMVAIGIGTGVGMNVALSKNLGQGNREKASKIAGNAIFLGIIIYIAFFLFGVFGAATYIKTQTSNTEILELATDYLRICCVLSIGIILFSVFEKMLQATGRSMFSTIAQITGAVANMILDPIMIYGLLGCPKLGVKGAAYATVIGQMISAIMGLMFHLTKNKELTNGIRYMKPSGKIIKEIYAIGFPAIIAQALMSFMTYGLNIILGKIDEAVVTAYGLYYKIQQFILFAAFGLRDAITPIVSFNYGKGDKERIKSGIKFGMCYTLVIMAFGMVILEIFAAPFATLFGLSGETEKLCIQAMRLVSISFLFAGANIAFQGIFQALNSGLETLIISICRQFLFVLPVAYLLSLPARENIEMTWLVWLTFPLAELLACIIAYIFMKRINKNKINW